MGDDLLTDRCGLTALVRADKELNPLVAGYELVVKATRLIARQGLNLFAPI